MNIFSNSTKTVLAGLFLLLSCFGLTAKAPTFIKPQEKVFIELCDLLEKKLAKDIEILVYDPDIFTASAELEESLTYDFKLLLEVQNLIRSYTTIPVKRALEENKDINVENLEEVDHGELLQIALAMNIESVLMTSITVFDDQKRKVWDKGQRKWIEKKAALIQGNVFNASNGKIMVRFSLYFLIDKE